MSDAAGLPAPVPAVSPETQAFWDATAQGRLLLPRCDDCGEVFWYPRGLCPRCGSLAVSWVEASGRGRIYSFAVNRRGEGDYAQAAPYVLAYVELDEGPRLMTNVVDADPAELAVDAPVVVAFADTGQGSALVRFRLA